MLKIYFICKITNNEIFKEYFPVTPQPYWDYFDKKGVIKIKLDPIDTFDTTTFEEIILHGSSLDVDFFKEFGEIFIYIQKNNKINIYKENDIISISDFDDNKNYSVIACYFNNTLLTKQVKMFLHKPVKIEHILLFCDSITESLIGKDALLINTNCINKLSINEFI